MKSRGATWAIAGGWHVIIGHNNIDWSSPGTRGPTVHWPMFPVSTMCPRMMSLPHLLRAKITCNDTKWLLEGEIKHILDLIVLLRLQCYRQCCTSFETWNSSTSSSVVILRKAVSIHCLRLSALVWTINQKIDSRRFLQTDSAVELKLSSKLGISWKYWEKYIWIFSTQGRDILEFWHLILHLLLKIKPEKNQMESNIHSHFTSAE